MARSGAPWTRAMTKPRRSRSSQQRHLAWLLIGLALVVWPAALLHEATTLHEICPEHGEILDVAKSSPVPDETHGGEPGWTSSGQTDGHHELCPFLTLGQPSSPLPQVRVSGVRLLETAIVSSGVREARILSIPILLLAPKHSPPAIA